MTRWSKDETRFIVNVNPNNNGEGGTSCVCRILKPIIKMLRVPDMLSFVVEDGMIIVENATIQHSYTVHGQKRGKRK